MPAVLLRVVLWSGIVCAGGTACATPGAALTATPPTASAVTSEAPAAAPSATSTPTAADAATATTPAYVPKTQHDNTPYRFDMNQNGKRMTAAEFDAWMTSRGIRVATGKPPATTSTDIAAATPAASAPAATAPAAAPSASPVAVCITSAPKDC